MTMEPTSNVSKRLRRSVAQLETKSTLWSAKHAVLWHVPSDSYGEEVAGSLDWISLVDAFIWRVPERARDR